MCVILEAWKYCARNGNGATGSTGEAKYCLIYYFKEIQEEYNNCQYCVCNFIPMLC